MENLAEVWRPFLSVLVGVRRGGKGGGLTADALRRDLLRLVAEADAKVKASGDERLAERHEEAKYAAVALADEIALHAGWGEAEREKWNSRILEIEVFRTNRAGEEFYDRLERLLERALPDEGDVREVFHLALSLGFRGRYRDRPSEDLEPIRERLLASVLGGRDARRIVPDLGEALGGGTETLLDAARLRVALVAAVLVAIGFFLVNWALGRAKLEETREPMAASVRSAQGKF